MVDHRRFGRTSDAADDALAALTVMFTMADDLMAYYERIERVRPWGAVATAVATGTLPDGGPFEAHPARRGGRHRHDPCRGRLRRRRPAGGPDELEDRFQASLPTPVAAGIAVQRQFLDVYVAGDGEGMDRLVATDGVVIDDHPLGFATFDRAGAVAAFAVAADRPAGFVVVVEEILALDVHGSVVASTNGT